MIKVKVFDNANQTGLIDIQIDRANDVLILAKIQKAQVAKQNHPIVLVVLPSSPHA